MKKSKLVYLLTSLTPDEFKRLGRFIRSPYFGYNENVTNLYNYLKKYYPEFEQDKLEREKAFARLFPDEAFNWNKLKKLMYTLKQLTEEYLIVMELEQAPFEKKKWFARALARRGLFDYFDRETQHLMEELDQQPFRDMAYFESKTSLLSERYFHPQFDRYQKKDHTLRELVDHFEAYYQLAALRFGSEMHNRKRLFKEKQSALAKVSLLDQNPTYQLYLLLREVQKNGLEQDFEQLEKAFFETRDQLSRVDQQIVYLNGLNYVIQTMNQGNARYTRKALQWYQYGLDSRLLMEQNLMSETTFGNIVTIACREKEFEWAAQFIEQYQQFLHPDQRQDVAGFNRISIHFYQNQFEDALRFLATHQFSISFQPHIRIMEVRAYFELFLQNDSYYDLLVSKTNAAENYFKRNTFFSKTKLEPYLNVVRIIAKLVNKILAKESASELLTWLAREKETRKINSINWLSKRIQRLK